MSVVAMKRKTEKRGARGLAAVVGNHLWTALVFAALAICALFMLAA